MTKSGVRRLPRWLFAVLMVGAFVASGIYLGIIRTGGVSTGHIVKAISYAVLGFLMLWGALGNR